MSDQSSSGAFSAEERTAMQDRAKELKAEAKRAKGAEKAAAEAAEFEAKIAGIPEPDRAMAERLHTIVREVAPDLTPKLYYG